MENKTKSFKITEKTAIKVLFIGFVVINAIVLIALPKLIRANDPQLVFALVYTIYAVALFFLIVSFTFWYISRKE